MEDELLKMTNTMEGLRVELPKEVITAYKKSTDFEMGLARTGQVLPKDSTVLMEADQPFNDSLPPPEE
ncbi:hypothetical protein BHE74_00032808 [Ensete ventricosum]|nr:hypothetical protein GW17_00056639 [Ensete ventricosum]RWW60218.1 hypothetical protein BHE74_00032808 [Ensete ventricosum]